MDSFLSYLAKCISSRSVFFSAGIFSARPYLDFSFSKLFSTAASSIVHGPRELWWLGDVWFFELKRSWDFRLWPSYHISPILLGDWGCRFLISVMTVGKCGRRHKDSPSQIRPEPRLDRVSFRSDKLVQTAFYKPTCPIFPQILEKGFRSEDHCLKRLMQETWVTV